eukprot:9309434-Alexandrium_andersonii.AAC.1
MSASLVGSEMCIRDSGLSAPGTPSCAGSSQRGPAGTGSAGGCWTGTRSVSYTHLTLPTICSV